MRSMISAIAVAAALGAAGAAQAQSPVQPVRTAYVVEPFTPSNQITIQGTGVRLRAEPFANRDTPVLSSGSTGLALSVVGIARLPDWNWYQVVLNNGQKAFIRSDLTSAPSKGGVAASAAAPLPAATRVNDLPVSAPLNSTPAYSTPAYSTPAYSTPAYPTPANSTPTVTTQPAIPTPAISAPPAYAPAPASPPISAPPPASASPIAPPISNSPISLVPRSPNSGGLSSNDPG